MYCTSCGAQSPPGSKYCRACGSALTLAASVSECPSSSIRVTGLFWAIAAFGVGSLAVFSFGVINLVGLGITAQYLVPLAAAGALMIFGVIALLIRQVSRIINLSQTVSRLPEFKNAASVTTKVELLEDSKPTVGLRPN